MNRSLRTRLLWHVGLGMLAMWLLLAPWLLMSVQTEMQKTLDNRLAGSAKMIMSLMTEYDLQPLSADNAALAKIMGSSSDILTSQACRIANASGSIIAMSNNAPAMFEENIPNSGYENQQFHGEGWRTFTLIDHGFAVTTAERISIRDQLMTSVIVAVAVPFTLGALGTLILLWYGIGQQLRPLTEMSQLVKKRHSHDLTALPTHTGPAEIEPLILAINDLLGRIESSLKRERRFTGDAAHELRTPLTGIKTHLQIAQLTQPAHALKQAEKATDHLQRTLDQLLLLTRAEEDLQLSDDIQLSIQDISELALNDVKYLSKNTNITINYTNNVDSVLMLPGTLLCAGLRNLLENAIRHSKVGDVINMYSQRENEQIVWTITDQGPGIPDEVLSQITQRFVHHGEESGSGLGLAIVDAIVQRFYGELLFENLSPHGLKVTLRIPLTT